MLLVGYSGKYSVSLCAAACQCFSAFSLSHPFGLVESRTAVTPAGDVEEGGCEVAAGEAHFLRVAVPLVEVCADLRA